MSEEVEYHWGETNGKKYKRGSRLPKKTDTQAPAPCAETPKVPWKWEEDGMTVIRGTARSAPGCHNVCGILTYVKDGKVVKVEGDPEDPYNQGRLCSRCLCIPDYVYHEDRITKPMKRERADRGKDKFVEISWDEAYDIIVENFKKVADTYGADKIAMCQGTGRDIHQVTRLNACMGSPNEGVPYFAGNSCYLPRIASMACMLGGSCVMDCSQFLPKRYDDPRYVVPEYCIIWGHQPFYSNADGFYGHWITDLMKRGMEVAVVDPQLTWIAAKAGENWLRVRPGGDGALAMAMLKVICDEKLYDADFCDKWVYGLEAVCERVAELDLDELCERAWVAKEDVVRVARTYAAAKPAAIQWGVALDQQTGGQQAAHAITALWCITGNLDVPGGNVMADACWGIEQPNWVGTWGWDELMTPEEQAKRIGIDRYPMFAVGFKNLSSNATIEAWQRGEVPIHAAYIVTNNFLATMGAQAEQQLEWYKQIDFIVVSDLFMTPTMMALADVVLPAATYEERDGFGGLNAYRISCIALSAVGVIADGVIEIAGGSNIATMMVGRFLEGTGIGLAGVSAPTLITLWFPDKTRGFALGLWCCWVPLSITLDSILCPKLAAAFGWQGVFGAVVAFAVVALVLFWVFYRVPEGENASYGAEGSFGECLSLLKNPQIWLLGLVFLIFIIGQTGIVNTYLSTFLQSAPPVGWGWSEAMAGMGLAVVTGISIVANPLGGSVTAKLPHRYKRIVPLGVAVSYLICFYLLFQNGNETLTWVGIVLMGVCGGFGGGGLRPLALTIMNQSAMAATMGMAVMQFVQCIGNCFSPVYGSLIDGGASFWGACLYTIIPLSIVMLVAAFFIRPGKNSPVRHK